MTGQDVRRRASWHAGGAGWRRWRRSSSSPARPRPRGATTVRIAVFNIRVLSTAKILEVDSTGKGINPQLIAAAEIIQRVRPDILLLNELWHDYAAVAQGGGLDENARRFVRAYLNRGDERFTPPSCSPHRATQGSSPDSISTATASLPHPPTQVPPRTPTTVGVGHAPRRVLDRGAVPRIRSTPRTHAPARSSGRTCRGTICHRGSTLRRPSPGCHSRASRTGICPVPCGTAVIHVFASVPTPGIFDGPEQSKWPPKFRRDPVLDALHRWGLSDLRRFRPAWRFRRECAVRHRGRPQRLRRSEHAIRGQGGDCTIAGACARAGHGGVDDQQRRADGRDAWPT